MPSSASFRSRLAALSPEQQRNFANLSDMDARRRCYLCYVDYQQKRLRIHKDINPPEPKEDYPKKGITLSKEPPSRGSRYSTEEGARLVARRAAKGATLKKARIRPANFNPLLCTIPEEQEEEDKGQANETSTVALSSFQTPHACAHMFFGLDRWFQGRYDPNEVARDVTRQAEYEARASRPVAATARRPLPRQPRANPRQDVDDEPPQPKRRANRHRRR